jgi:hypothetical protein
MNTSLNGPPVRILMLVLILAFSLPANYLVLRSCTHDTLSVPGKDAHRCGVLKLPFTGTG